MTTGTLTLAEFLLARIAEDEAAAGGAFRDVNDGSSPDFGMAWWAAGDAVMTGQTYVLEQDAGIGDTAVAEHVARHDPARVLAKCEAERQIVTTYTAPAAWPLELRYLDDDIMAALEWVMKQLALPYANHPDYDESWQP